MSLIFRYLARDIAAKVDTGAYTSAINCSRVKVKEVKGQKELTFIS